MNGQKKQPALLCWRRSPIENCIHLVCHSVSVQWLSSSSSFGCPISKQFIVSQNTTNVSFAYVMNVIPPKMVTINRFWSQQTLFDILFRCCRERKRERQKKKQQYQIHIQSGTWPIYWNDDMKKLRHLWKGTEFVDEKCHHFGNCNFSLVLRL